ncbi:SDR family NAD(P)-dependent oxidoreductase [Streptomyces sp. NPDC002742]|uniref:SDR family NAD(P)-dependent oxidoreductase n=1 Tax=Streptomyces sp. NPDC002742 TaxID=3364663 RepID=UPI0036A22B8A
MQRRNVTAVVTGAARGIGAAIARRLAAEGRAIATVDIDSIECESVAREINECGGTALAVTADVGNIGDIRRATAQIAEALGPPLILVNNAGFSRPSRIAVMRLQDWEDVMTVHLRAASSLTREVAPYMLEAGWGRIVNISSIAALGRVGSVNYSTAKAGIVGLTKESAVALGPHGITVNCIAPGFVMSRLTEAAAHRLGRTFHEHQKIEAHSIPVGRVGRPEDVANATAFFTSDEAQFISGQVLSVDGGPNG